MSFTTMSQFVIPSGTSIYVERRDGKGILIGKTTDVEWHFTKYSECNVLGTESFKVILEDDDYEALYVDTSKVIITITNNISTTSSTASQTQCSYTDYAALAEQFKKIAATLPGPIITASQIKQTDWDSADTPTYVGRYMDNRLISLEIPIHRPITTITV